MALISIIVPVYNVEKYLHKCINSILNQTFKEFELILVDDGSTDKSAQICDEYKRKDSRIKVIHKKNGGLSDARNMGLESAVSEYIAFIDSDDFIHPQMFEILYNISLKYDSDISMCDFKRVYENDIYKLRKYKTNNQEVLVYTSLEALNQLYSENTVKFVAAWNKLYKRNIFINLKYKNNKIHEDEFIIHELLYRSKKIVYTPVPLYYYLQREGSIMKSKFNVKRLDGLDAYRERIKFFKKIDEKILFEKAIFVYSREFFLYYYKLKNEVSDSDKYLKKIKKDYTSLFRYIMKNQYYTKKEKLVIAIFCINTKLYEKYISFKNGGYKCKGKIGQP